MGFVAVAVEQNQRHPVLAPFEHVEGVVVCALDVV